MLKRLAWSVNQYARYESGIIIITLLDGWLSRDETLASSYGTEYCGT